MTFIVNIPIKSIRNIVYRLTMRNYEVMSENLNVKKSVFQ